MRGTTLKTHKFNYGYYLSRLDNDNAFISDTNKNGLFKMLICPVDKTFVENSKTYIEGESYIITGATVKEIDKKAKETLKAIRKWGGR